MERRSLFALVSLLAISLVPLRAAAPGGGLRQEDLATLVEILEHAELVDLETGEGGTVRTLRLTGINLQLVNGLGATDSKNGTANLILGYNEKRIPADEHRTGSHNLVIGRGLNYTSAAGIVHGQTNAVGARYGAAIAGEMHEVLASNAAVVGGLFGRAQAAGALVLGGRSNQASGIESVAVGGQFNTAWEQGAFVAGGSNNFAGGILSACTGGQSNTAAQTYATVSGGRQRTAPGLHDWVAGALFQDE